MEDRVFPDSDSWSYDFLPSYLADPGAGLTDFVYATGPQYGHFVFDRYLDEHVGGPDLVRDAWVDAAPGDDVKDTLDRLLSDVDGGDLAGHWGDFLAHMAAFDFTDRDLFVAASDRADGVFYEVDTTAPGSGEGEGIPDRFGAAYLHFTAPEGEGIRFTLTAPDGDWVVGGSDGVTFQCATSGDAIEIAASDAWIGVGPTGRRPGAWEWSADTFALPDSASPEPEDEPAGCGCAGTDPSSPAAAFAVLLALAGHRRSRRPRV
jgi:MYXO-CTERM domain-containing protein